MPQSLASAAPADPQPAEDVSAGHGAPAAPDRIGNTDAPLPAAPHTTQPVAGEQPTSWLAVAKEFRPHIYLLVLLSLSLPGALGTYVLIQSAFFPDHIRPWIESAGVLGAIAFAAAFAITTGSAILPTYALSFAAGVMLGGPQGALVAMTGVTLGSLIGYGWGTLLGRGDVMRVIDKHERARLVRNALLDRSLRDETLMVGLLRFPPNSPFALTNLAMASTAVRLLPFVVGTAVGIAPRTLLAVYLGSQRDAIADFKETGWMPLAGLAIGLVVFYFIYRLFSRWAKAALEKRLA